MTALRDLFTWPARLWRDQSGSLDASAYLLMATILAIGGIVGLTTIRDQVAQEFGDVAVGLEKIDQSFSVTIETPDGVFKTFEFMDAEDGGDDVAGEAPGCMDLCNVPVGGETN